MNGYEVAERLYSLVKAGEDGTIATDGAPLPEMGYYVGGRTPSLVYKSVEDVDRGEIAYWVGTHGVASFYGVWTDSETGTVYFDAVSLMESRAAANLLAKRRGELAIWDIANGEEIRTQP